ncbi:MAG TPA: hypothetical protein VNL15_06285 [Dehalococcoidia bacterium]|nr:hypothetical protein [Dehalococcoidia bacterium]
MRARFFRTLPQSDRERVDAAIAYFRRLYPFLPVPNILALTNLCVDYWDRKEKYQ